MTNPFPESHVKLNLTRIIGVAFTALTVTSASAFAAKTPTICKDGTTSATSGRGACSGHGGVDAKATAAAKKAEKDAAKAAKKAAKAEKDAAKSAKKAETRAKKEATEPRAKKVAAEPRTEAKPAKIEKEAKAPTPRASARAREKASPRSAVAAGNGSAESNNPSGAIAKCKDGLYSHARNRRGACAQHGGVASWM